MQVISKIKRELGADITLRTIFEEPNIEGICKVISSVGRLKYPQIERLPKQDYYELSHAQKRLWFLDQLTPDTPTYNIPMAVMLEGDLDVDAMRDALQVVVDRHESLRTIFKDRDGKPIQIVLDDLRANIEIVDPAGASINEDRLRMLAFEEAIKPFNLSQGPLFRLKLFKVSPNRHLFVFTMHHIISDGWSMETLIEELISTSIALAKGEGLQLPDLSLQYKDFAHWQNKILEDGTLKDQEDYWLEKLGGGLPVLDLPTDYPRPPMETNNGAVCSFTIDPDITSKLRNIIRDQGVTLFMLLLASFDVLLMKLSNQENIIVGSPIAGRSHPGLEDLIGFFVNMLALRTNLSDDLSFIELLKRVKETCLDAYANQDYPFDRLIDLLNPVRDTSRPPIFNVMFVLQNESDILDVTKVGDIGIKNIEWDSRPAKFDLSLYVSEFSDRLEAQFEYNTDLFNRDTIQRVSGYFSNLLGGIAANPGTHISGYKILGEEEKQRILVEFNNTDAEFPGNKCIYQLIEEQVARTPEGIAVSLGDDSLTYKQLNERSNQLARYLRARGVGKETMVGLMLDRSLEMMIALLGVLKAGGAYVPIGTDYPISRVEYILDDTHAPVVLTQERFIKNLPDRAIQIVCLDTQWSDIAQEDSENLDPISDPEDLAYVIYTSGSTGIPKGVACIHKGLCNRLVWMQDAYRLKYDDCVLQKTPYTFDVSGWEFFWALMYGARIHFLRPGGEKDPSHIMEVIRDKKITTMHFVPSMLSAFLHVLDDKTKEYLSCLRRVICSGEALLAEHRDRFFKYLDCELHNLYGPTEASIDVTYFVCSPEDKASVIPIGKPIANTQIYILDKYMQPTPVGVPGEIYLAGVGLARGYVNKPEKTAQAFIASPLAKDGRLYKTGDLGKWLGDGNIEYLGKIDHQVKIRGNRIELGEVESILAKYEGVLDCVVVDKDDKAGEKYLVGYYVAEQEISVSDLRGFLKERLPEYMIPSRFMHLEGLPLSPNGKVDRKALPEPEDLRPEMESEYVAPRNATEQAIVGILEDVLGIDKVGIYDNFFDLGGHSLKATQVVSRIKKDLEVDFALAAMFEHQSVAEMGKLVEDLNASGKRISYQDIIRGEKQPYYEVSAAQRRLWFLDKMTPNNPAYNIPGVLVFDDSLDIDAFHKALQAVIDRHASFRTTFATIDGKPMQIVADSMKLDLPIVDISNLEVSNQPQEIRQIVMEECLNPFDLEQGPLVRAKFIVDSSKRYIFIINMHHIISDGWSLGILAKDIGLFYDAFAHGKTLDIPDLPLQYTDFACWQNKVLRDGTFDSQKNYWVEKLGGELPILDLPTDHPRPVIMTYNGSSINITTDTRLTSRLKTFVKQQGLTLFMLLLASFQVLLTKLSSQEDIIVGTPIAGRNYKDLEDIIGFFVNTLALRSDLSGNPGFTELLDQVKKTCIDAYANQDIPFDELITILNPQRHTDRSPIFSVMFDLENIGGNLTHGMSSTDTMKSLEDMNVGSSTAKFDLMLSVKEWPDILYMQFEYNTDLFERETIERFAGYYQTLLTNVLDNPTSRLSDLEILNKTEKRQLLMEFNDTASSFPSERCIHELFEKQVERIPDIPAVVFMDQSLSYRELSKKANQLAHYLRSLGIGRSSLVGVMMDHSIEMVLSMLAILKAGGAYLPLDPGYPEERLRFMMANSGTKVIITTEKFFHKIPAQDMSVVCLDMIDKEISAQEDTNLDVITAPEDLAYSIYTSGSTGRPKGNMLHHKGVVNLVTALKQQIYSAYDSPLNVGLMASFSFDASVQQIFAALLLGHTLYPIPEEIKQDATILIPYIKEHRIQVIDATPSLVEIMSAGGMAEEVGLGLKHYIIGAEPLSPSLVERFFGGGKNKEVKWTNIYGITECHVDSVSYLIDPDVTGKMVRIPIGKPLCNTQIYILDKYMNPVPMGVQGEIYIGGVGVGYGYLNDSERTKKAFVKNPFGQGSVYKTGDLGRWLPDGNIECLGRIDHQVKIRGYRIELGEIESGLSNYPLINDCVVIDKDDKEGNKHILAYYVSDQEISVSDLRKFLKETLPDYMIPTRFIPLESLPLTPSGKVDRKSLPEPEGLRPEISSEYVVPRNEIEQVIVDVWQEVLGIDRIGVYDNFFDLGGDSIISIQVVSHLKRKGLEIKPRHIFEHQCIAELAQVAEVATVIEAYQGPVVGVSPLTPIQRWFFEQDLENRHHFNQGVMFRSEMGIKEEALRKTLRVLIDHHDVLRMRFKKNGASHIQEFMPLGEDVSLVVKDLSENVNKDRALEEEVTELQSSLDIERGPVFRAGLYHIGSRDYLVLVGHHLVMDGVSWRILLEDLLASYDQTSKSEEIILPDKTTSYRDWAISLNEYARSDGILKEASYWEGILPDSIPELPVDHDLGVNDIASTDVVSIELGDKDTHALLKGAHRAYNTEVNDLLLTAFMRALQGWTGRDDVLFDLEGHGREDMIDGVDISRTVGWFTTIFPVALSIDRNADIGSHIKYVKERLHTIPNKGFNFGVLKYMYGRDFGGYTSAGISFNYLGQVPNMGSDSSVSIVDMDVKIMTDRHNKRSNLIDVVCIVEDSHLTVEFIYSKNKYVEATINSLAKRFKKGLLDVIHFCIRPGHEGYTPSDFELKDITQDQLDELLEEIQDI